MKKLIVLLSLTLFAINTQAQMRRVGQFTVNLSPVSEWMSSNKKSERPMPHWKKVVFVTDHGPKFGGIHEIEISADGVSKRVLVQNVPARIKNLLSQQAQLEAQLNRATAASAYTSAAANHAKSQTSAGWSASGSAAFVNAVAAEEDRKQRVAANRQAVAELTESQRRAIQSKLVEIRSELLSTFDLAMFTGRTMASLEIWDCGIPL
jgi:hypothetical protein